MDNLARYGNKIELPTFSFSKEEISSDFYSVRPEFVLLFWSATVFTSFAFEFLVMRRVISNRCASLLHLLAGVLNLVFPCAWVGQTPMQYKDSSFLLDRFLFAWPGMGVELAPWILYVIPVPEYHLVDETNLIRSR